MSWRCQILICLMAAESPPILDWQCQAVVVGYASGASLQTSKAHRVMSFACSSDFPGRSLSFNLRKKY